MGLFDSYRTAAHAVIGTVMGEQAAWMRSGMDTLTATVLFNEPTEKQRVDEFEYDTQDPWIEYLEGTFPGLFEAVQQNRAEEIQVSGRTFITTKNGSRKHDGSTIIIKLKEAE